jgi:GAF domain-containing protein
MSHFEAWTQTVDEGVIGRVVRTGEPALVPDTARDPDFLRTNARRVSGSELAVPIRVAGEIWGALNVEELEQNAFGLGDLLFADGVAGQVGAALHRARVAVQAADGAPVRSSP